jgi:hypothetical protein
MKHTSGQGNLFLGKETVNTAETKVNETFCFPFFFRPDANETDNHYIFVKIDHNH